MPHNIDMVMDFQYGSTGKGLIAGWLATRNEYDTAVCSFATNAGHTYIGSRGFVMTQQLPTAIVGPTVKNILIGPGAAIHTNTLIGEIVRYGHLLEGKRLMIHPQAAIVEDYHATQEVADGRTTMGSTGKGVGEAYIERIRRRPDNNTAKVRLAGTSLESCVLSESEYRDVIEASQSMIVEGAQGFSLSMYHGQYPYTTSRDVTPWQIAADCGLPYRAAPYVKVIGTLRTFPIRVNNRDGSSGPCYPDQKEITWDELGIEPELTTVTKLPRRIFTFSEMQLAEAMFHCGGYWDTRLFLNFANYLPNEDAVQALIKRIEAPKHLALNPPHVNWIGYGPTDGEIRVRNRGRAA